MARHLLWVTGRLVFCGFFLLTSLYGVLAYVPFTYQQVVQFKLLGGLTWFATNHHLLFWPAAAIGLCTLREEWHHQPTRRLTLILALALGAAGINLLVHPALAAIDNSITSLALGLSALVPVYWIALIDQVRNFREVRWSTLADGQDGRFFCASLATGLFVALLYAGIFAIRFVLCNPIGIDTSTQAMAFAFSMTSHVMLFLGVYLVMNLALAFAAYFRSSVKAHFVLCALLLTALTVSILRSIVLGAISFSGPLADTYAVALGGALIAILCGTGVRAAALSGAPPGSGVELLLKPFALGSTSRVKGALVLASIATLAYIVARNASAMDWNFLVQKMAALMVWTLVMATIHGMMPAVRVRRVAAPALLIAPFVTLGAYRTLDAAQPAATTTLDRYAGYDVSYKVIRDALAQPQSGDPGIYGFLQRVTNISRDTPIAPLDVNFAAELKPSTSVKPNIIIIVIDSLRRDYLASYNDKIDFTPNLARFAADGVAFRNAFTHYGATGLSEPSIWVGGMFPHKQYIVPFFPMNALQKLVEAEHYQCFISLDTILRSVVQPSPSIIELDQGVLNKDYDLSKTLVELQQKIDARDPARPFFVYTQPQNIHISRITREGGQAIDALGYGSFYAPYASRLRRIDRAFGEFIDFLKARGLYDQSIIVFTADHGDSLGEDGRWGHAYTIYPEVVRIPLIVHVPAELRAAHVYDANDLAFSTDVTPSLYYLLGHAPTLTGPMFGRPLFTKNQGERTSRSQEFHLLASSYGPVYGILRDQGRALYIVDAVNYSDYDYDLASPLSDRRREVSAQLRTEQARLIRQRIDEIHTLYQVAPLQ